MSQVDIQTMPYISRPLLERALTGLGGKSPIPVVIIPAMVNKGLGVITSPVQAKQYGGADETRILEEFFRIPGAPPTKPYRAIWEDRANIDVWRNVRTADTTFQRQRKGRADSGKVFIQADRRHWGLRPNCGAELAADLPDDHGLIRIVDLAIWYGRTWDVPDLTALVAKFSQSFPLEIPSIRTQSTSSGLRVQDTPVPRQYQF